LYQLREPRRQWPEAIHSFLTSSWVMVGWMANCRLTLKLPGRETRMFHCKRVAASNAQVEEMEAKLLHQGWSLVHRRCLENDLKSSFVCTKCLVLKPRCDFAKRQTRSCKCCTAEAQESLQQAKKSRDDDRRSRQLSFVPPNPLPPNTPTRDAQVQATPMPRPHPQVRAHPMLSGCVQRTAASSQTAVDLTLSRAALRCLTELLMCVDKNHLTQRLSVSDWGAVLGILGRTRGITKGMLYDLMDMVVVLTAEEMGVPYEELTETAHGDCSCELQSLMTGVDFHNGTLSS